MKRTKPANKKILVSLTLGQWVVVKMALDKSIRDGGGILFLLTGSGPYKKLHRQIVGTLNSVNRQLRDKK